MRKTIALVPGVLVALCVAAGCQPASGTPPGGGIGIDGGNGTILRTLVYHELTADENGGVDTTKGIAFSRDGRRGLFDENIASNYVPTVVSADGSGKSGIDAVNAGWIDMTAVSGDGAWIAYTADTLFLANVASPQRVAGPAVSQGRSCARFARDPADAMKWRLYFLSNVAWGSPAHEPGVYSVGTDGAGLVELMSPAQAAALIGNGTTAADVSPKGSLKRGLDVSADGKQLVAVWSAGACTQQGEKDYVVGSTTDGTTSMVILGPFTDGCGVEKIALSGDGSTVAFDVDDSADTGQRDVGVVGFGAAGKRTLATFAAGDDNNWGISDDGKLVVANYKLHNADGSGSFDLAVQGGTFSNDPPSGIDLLLGTPNGKADRILYVNSVANPRRMAALEIDPTTMGAAPTIANPSVTPASVPANGSASATLTAKVASTSGKVVRVGAAALQNASHDDKELADVVLFDDGTHGDAVAGDGVYSDNELRASAGAKSGPRTIRVRATVVDAAGKSHSTAIEFGAFAVQ
jgi:hypothetical protein